MRCRFVWVLLFMCVAESKAEVFGNFKRCSKFFFQDTSPIIEFPEQQPFCEYICQRFDTDEYYYATLYMSKHRIPLFSAYRLDKFKSENQPSKRSKWFIEPELIIWTNSPYMRSERWYDQQALKEKQAINEDYRNTNYDRGHLNPSSYHSDNARTATFTLTNAVPQDPCFNRQKWMAMEQESKRIMQDLCDGDDDQRYFVTGVFPSDNTKIPSKYDEEDDRDMERDKDRVNVPIVMWTAACCFFPNDKSGFSFSYYGYNEPEPNIEAFLVDGLQKTFKDKFQINARIFHEYDNCFSEGDLSYEVFFELSRFVENMNRHLLIRNGIEPLFYNQNN